LQITIQIEYELVCMKCQ